MTLRIGISARLLHQPPAGSGLPRKRLQFLESNMAQWIMSHGVVALMIPFVDHSMVKTRRRLPILDLVEQLDGLVLQGGADISPRFYGAKPWTEHCDCDPIRDEYELELMRGFVEAGKPVLGICRGAQMLNVYCGGTLVQDIPSQWPGAIPHLDLNRYETLTHEVHFVPGSRLSDIYGYAPQRVNSIHHQCVGELGKGLVIEARSPIDRVPEAIRHTGHAFVMGVQWHPEFQFQGSGAPSEVLDSGPLMMAFLKAALRRAGRVRRLTDSMSRVRERALEFGGGF
ncbi:MAG: gamma-glutamyl-gamma-aminobutyrate hydrolase family protein [Burkholderiales bacterium]|uniref:Gamma-glutamyl-gamma-aminobutyrate hydrolase family protein n=1 Tax=Ottowia pentelensis TaxID=511108 RepID=A0ABV6PQA4_9BURK|nr:gamma-glutamyl-gamma-aminobutyrate hydrolase family protein [Ottowia sp.]MBN9407092.1 gamma-glutamyl-gamma-aminobutyrate hydrolase family protein [Burkholderiales bacterium]MBS0401464.1 gamma-glutamyl-gamma-aminobutyrate hydrolase family protein [Pseudomonadota bacterium]MBS0413916.1 gamma-glutamyl-gamma-aminobutyrate hydrolase family protein [Pseudomonadota bacterium]